MITEIGDSNLILVQSALIELMDNIGIALEISLPRLHISSIGDLCTFQVFCTLINRKEWGVWISEEYWFATISKL